MKEIQDIFDSLWFAILWLVGGFIGLGFIIAALVMFT